MDKADVKAKYSVIDAHDHPHGGRILRLRLRQGEALSLKELKRGSMIATTADGATRPIQVDGFALFGGKVSDARLALTGRVDIHVHDKGADGVGAGWTISGPA
jgi:hypothetical protein